MNMRIGIFSDTYAPDVNGVVTSVMLLQKTLEDHGHEVFVITNHPKLIDIHYQNHVLRLPGIKLKSLYGYVMTSPIQLRAYRMIRKMKLDLIHVHSDFGVGMFSRFISFRLNLPIVFTYHTEIENYTHYINPLELRSVEKFSRFAVAKLSKQLGDHSTAVIAPSKKTKDMLLRYGVKKDIFIVPTGVDLERFSSASLDINRMTKIRLAYGILPEECLFIYVGRIAKEKSIDLVIDGFHHVDFESFKCKLLIVGDGPQLNELRQQVLDLNLEKQVKFAGKKSADDVPYYYNAAQAFICASRTETQGLTYLEAMASGLPILARPDKVLEGLVHEGTTGFYFETEEELARTVERFARRSKEEVDELKKNIHETIRQLDREVFYHNIMEVYESALKDFNPE
ncbi:MAG TPA: hypothetical protein DCP62_06815 [Erysipelotrichaceae bacterium]|nr:hypothetical protein [Erysipelotrichaceae bacterium]